MRDDALISLQCELKEGAVGDGDGMRKCGSFLTSVL